MNFRSWKLYAYSSDRTVVILFCTEKFKEELTVNQKLNVFMS
jgi:hypothetical protein